jgi:hypothetical protein
MADLRLDAGMGPAVLDHLRQFATLPEDGLVAGQSVASAVSQLFGDGWGVAYNDIDVFRHYRRLEEDEERRSRREAKRVVDTVHFTALEVDVGGWTPYSAMREVSVKRQGKYSVVKTMREDMLNMVYYDHGYAEADASFLSTFDINAGHVGVDISTQKLLWTPEFERYLRTRQLEIVTLHTPYQSLIRYFKKREELEGVYGNDARMTEMIGLAYAVATSPSEGYNPQEDASLRWRFGAAIADKLDGVMSDIRPNFDILSEKVQGMDLYQLVPRFEADRDMLKLVRRQRDIAHLLPRFSRTLREARRKAFAARAHHVAEAPIELDRDRVNPQNVSQLLWLQQGDAALEANVTVQQMADLDRFVFEHDASGFFLGRSLARSIQVKQQMEAAVQARGNWVYRALGLLSDEDPNEAFEVDGWLDGWMVREDARHKSHVLAGILPKGYSALGVEVVELCSRRDLLDEGTELHHCVGTYSALLPEGNSRFFSIRPACSSKSWLTLHLVMSLDGLSGSPTHWRISQLKGLCNRDPLDHEQAIVAQFVEDFNAFYVETFASGWYRMLDIETRRAIAHERATGTCDKRSFGSLATSVAKVALRLPARWLNSDGVLVDPRDGVGYWQDFAKWKLEQVKRATSRIVRRLSFAFSLAGMNEDEDESVHEAFR